MLYLKSEVWGYLITSSPVLLIKRKRSLVDAIQVPKPIVCGKLLNLDPRASVLPVAEVTYVYLGLTVVVPIGICIRTSSVNANADLEGYQLAVMKLLLSYLNPP